MFFQQFCPALSEHEAKKFLLCSIYEVDDVDVTLIDSPVTSHIVMATPKDKVRIICLLRILGEEKFFRTGRILRIYNYKKVVKTLNKKSMRYPRLLTIKTELPPKKLKLFILLAFLFVINLLVLKSSPKTMVSALLNRCERSRFENHVQKN